jgi:hypothetical protein
VEAGWQGVAPPAGGVEGGLLLLTLGLTLACVLRRLGAPTGARRSLALWGAVGAVGALTANALIDAPLRDPAVALGLACIAGLAWSARTGPSVAARRRATRAVLSGLALLLVVLSGSSLLVDFTS